MLYCDTERRRVPRVGKRGDVRSAGTLVPIEEASRCGLCVEATMSSLSLWWRSCVAKQRVPAFAMAYSGVLTIMIVSWLDCEGGVDLLLDSHERCSGCFSRMAMVAWVPELMAVPC